MSPQPDSVRYCFDLWAQQVADFACQVVQPQNLCSWWAIRLGESWPCGLLSCSVSAARLQPR